MTDSFGADLAGTSTDFAANIVAFRIFDQMPNTGAWGAVSQPPDGGNSPSGYWATRTITGSNANASTVATPAAGNGADGAEVPVSLTAFHVD